MTATTRRCGAAVLLVGLTGCFGPRNPTDERVARARSGKGDLVIAAAWPWELRKEIRYGEGLELAIEEANAGGGLEGRRLRLARYDDKESIDEGGLVAQKIAADPDVVAVIGHLQSYITVQTATVYDESRLVVLAPTATDPVLTARGHTRLFRATFTDTALGRRLAEFAGERGFKKVAIYYIRNGYGKNVANAFESASASAGVTVVARSSYDPSQQAGEHTFKATLDEWKAMDIDAILLAGEVPSAAIFVAQARALGIKAPILGGDAMSSPGLMAVAGKAAEGVIVASFFHPDEPRPEVAAFRTAFKKKHGVEPDAGSALGYDCVRLLVAAMQQAHSAIPDDVARALHASRDWHGVTGTFTFDEHGDVVGKPILLSVVRGGQFEYLAAPRTAGTSVAEARP
jgi:branched-chain amino acid transport system substrate-binding protein